MSLRQETIVIDDINNKEEILEILKYLETDEDFNGNNGKDYYWEETLEKGFKSNQDFVIDKLKNSNLNGENLILEFFREWLDNDGYYEEWKYDSFENDGKTIVSVAISIDN